MLKVTKIADNVISPLGMTTEENYLAIKRGVSRLRLHEGEWRLPESFVASLFTDEQNATFQKEGFTRFESLVIASVRKALEQTTLNVRSKRIVFVLSTTKGNVELLDEAQKDKFDAQREYPGVCAKKIAEEIGFVNEPIVVCNACISGVSAISTATRLLRAGFYDYAVVCGADVQGKFIVSGFQSFKALSKNACRPFDADRDGLNLGEAAATVILSAKDDREWSVYSSAVRNDANHISGPSRTGEGSFRALQRVLIDADKSNLAFVGVHGTATLYNDEMESIAIERAGLSDIPLNALKGYYGHTMGAAGVLEMLLSIKAVEDGVVIGTRGFEKMGVSGKINVSNKNRSTDGKNDFIKLLSGFGGCNAALLVKKNAEDDRCQTQLSSTRISHKVLITSRMVVVDGEELSTRQKGKELLSEIYAEKIGSYPKFHKMDTLCKAGFVAAELLLQAEGKTRFEECENRAVVLFNRASSLNADRKHQQSIQNMEDFYPSPAVFVYTLPNIITGEIAIRNKYYGETSFYVLADKNEELMNEICVSAFEDKMTQSMITGWVDCEDDDNFEVDMYIIEKK